MLKAGANYVNYNDGLAQKRRRRFFVKILAAFIGLLGFVTLSFYLMFFSKFMQIGEVSIEGLKNINSDEILTVINAEINRDFFEPISVKLQKNIFFFDETLAKEKLLAQFPIIRQLEIKKDYLNKMIVIVTERTPLGTWCIAGKDSYGAATLTAGCRYFDEEGFLWGKALKSSGSLLLMVNDLQSSEKNKSIIEANLIEAIRTVVTGIEKLDIKIKNIEISEEPLDDIKIYTLRGYYILFDSEQDIAKQVESLRIFLSEKDDSAVLEYIDARIPGRLYYK